ncbi:MAG: OmpA family protein [Acetobacteraceae bacterium]|nr:OmpA family protein [Acetobacteraceae bacterium]
MPQPARLAAALAAFLLPLGAAAQQEPATGTVTIQQPPPRPSGAVVSTPNGRTVEVPPGAAAQIGGANVVVEEPTARGSRITMQNDVLFAFDKSDLRPEAESALSRVAEIIRQRHPREARIIGHTDSIGSEEYNLQLSKRRAEAVEQWLGANGGGMPPMQVEGRGESDPVAPNAVAGHDNPEGRQKNRRVEVLLEG